MRHVILGAGGIGGLVAAALARQGEEVSIAMRPGSAARYHGRLHVASAVMGTFDVEVHSISTLQEEVDVAWIAVKSNQLADALPALPANLLEGAVLIPLLNGTDHVQTLRAMYGPRVLPAAIRVESERPEVGVILQSSPFIVLQLAPPAALVPQAEAVAAHLIAAGFACTVLPDQELRVLWGKLALLAPLALSTTALEGAIGEVRADPEAQTLMLACSAEVCAVASALGCPLDPQEFAKILLGLPPNMRSSMQKDLAAGQPLELDFISGPVVRGGTTHRVPTPATIELDRRVRDRFKAAAGSSSP